MDRQSKIKEIFLSAVGKATATERDAYLDQACGDDVELRDRVRDLLSADEQPASYLDKPALDFPETRQLTGECNDVIPDHGLDASGTQFGPYKLLQEIGQGGFGVVYMAVQQHPVRRTVALKIIKPGMDSQEVIARFEAERQALALMDHPNIAKVLDAGATTDGRPYFVMELVKGVPILSSATATHSPRTSGWSCSLTFARPCSTRTKRVSSTAT